MRSRQVIFYATLACGVVVLAAWLLSARPWQVSPPQRLADGSLVVLQHVTYGRIHRFPLGNVWQQLGAHLLPRKYARRFPALAYTSTAAPALVLWIKHVGITASSTPSYGSGSGAGEPAGWPCLFDDSGTELPGESWLDVSAAIPNGFEHGLVFHALPSTSRQLHFRFVSGQCSAIFTFPNPSFQAARQKPSAYPLTAQQDKLRLVLTSFQPEPRRKAHSKEMGLAFDLFENAHPATNWELHSLLVLDPHGAAYAPPTASWGQSENHVGITFAGGLSTNAPWKLRFVLKHRTFLSNELCTIRGLSLAPGGDQATNLIRIPFQRTTLVIRWDVSGPWDSWVHATLAPPDEHYYMNFVDVLGADGRPLSPTNTYYSGQSDTNFSLGFPLSVTNVDLTFGITRKVFIELTAQPTP